MGRAFVLRTQENIKSPQYTESHAILGMKALLEINCSEKFQKKDEQDFIFCENLKISQLEQEIQLSKL